MATAGMVRLYRNRTAALIFFILTVQSNTARSPAYAQIEPEYVIAMLESLGGDSYHMSSPSAINDRGLIVGQASSPHDVDLACEWRDAHPKALGALPNCYESAARSVNRQGWIVGNSSGNQILEPAFLWHDGRMVGIGGLGGARISANSINDRGEVVGEAQDSKDNYRPYIYRSGRMKRLPVPEGCWGSAEAINNRGTIAGAIDKLNGFSTAVIWKNGKLQTIGTLGGNHSKAYAINQLGDVVGDSDVRYGQFQRYHGFLWSGRKMTDLGSLGSGYGRAWAINNKRQIVGETFIDRSDYPQHAFLYANGKMKDLNDMVSLNSGWILRAATGINNRGEIIGYGQYKDREAGFLLTPSKPEQGNNTKVAR